jgi:hypothetical protein
MKRGLALGALAVVLLGLVIAIERQRPVAVVAVGYMARVACACHFIAGRPLQSCHADGERGTELVQLTADERERRVIATVPVLATASATHTPGLGCVLNP